MRRNQPNWFGWNLLPQISGVNIRDNKQMITVRRPLILSLRKYIIMFKMNALG